MLAFARIRGWRVRETDGGKMASGGGDKVCGRGGNSLIYKVYSHKSII